jgi:hypothetical protein
MEIIIVILLIIIAYIIFNKIKVTQSNDESKEINPDTELPYRSKFLLTKSEYYFYNTLKPIIHKHNCIICPKVGLKDIFEVTDKTNYMKWFSRINQKHIDFLICDSNLKPLFGLELDDRSHEKEKALKNDAFKNRLFEKVNIPLKRVKVNTYDNLEEYLFPAINNNENIMVED